MRHDLVDAYLNSRGSWDIRCSCGWRGTVARLADRWLQLVRAAGW
jgi:hypothetical protein